jgi:asparagine synthase (glutamine-hydrolysing)
MNRVLRLFFRLLRERKKNIKHPDYGYLKDFLIRKYNLKLIDKKIAVERGNGLIDSQQRRYNFIYMPLTFQHFGYYDTCRSLFYGFLPLDPTLSSDIIELCLAMPIDCFFHNGKERRAVRDYMSGIVSDSILNNLKKRGRQGADYVYRFNKFIDSEYALLVKYLNNPLLYHYLDKEKIQKLIEIIKENKYNLDSKTIVYACVSSSLSHFLLSQNTSIGGE